MPTTKGTRAIPATVLPTPPALPTVTSRAASIPTKPIFSAAEPIVIAWNTPLFGSTSAAGTSDSNEKVPIMYIAAINAAAVSAARGRVRRGSRISPLIAETSSRPVNANAICDQKFTVSQFQVGITFAQVNCVTEPFFSQSTVATPIKITSGKYVE